MPRMSGKSHKQMRVTGAGRQERAAKKAIHDVVVGKAKKVGVIGGVVNRKIKRKLKGK